MLTMIFAGTARYRRPILAMVAALAAGCLALGIGADAHTRSTLSYPLFAATPVVGVAAAVASRRRRPAGFEVDERRAVFRAPPYAGRVCLATAGVLAGTALALVALGATRSVPHAIAQEPLLVMWPVVAWYAVTVWFGRGLRLRPDGVVDQGPFGTFTVPWEALTLRCVPPPSWARDLYAPAFARLDLIRRRGFLPYGRMFRVTDIDPRFLDAALRYYVAHPERRCAIGTRAGYDDLLRALSHA